MQSSKAFNIIFFALCTFMCFTFLPVQFQASGILFGSLSAKLMLYPVLAGIVYTTYIVCKRELVCAEWGSFKKYIFAYVALSLISVVFGLVNFPYYDVVSQTSMNAFRWATFIRQLFQGVGFNFSDQQLVAACLIFRCVKNLCVDMFFCYGIAYMLYCWYADDWKRGFKVMGYGCLTGLALVLFYGVLDIMYLAHCQIGETLLTILNPCVHPIRLNGSWHPPMFWNAFRSLFCEPSYFGMWAAVVLPFVWYQCLRLEFGKKLLLFMLVNVYFAFCLFLSNSRTCIGILLIELFAMFVALLWQRNSKWLKKCLLIIVGVVFAFGLNIGFQSKFMQADIGASNVVQNYVDQNIKTLSYTNKGRSNSQRWAVIQSDIKLFADHPFFGVGYGLSRFYVYDYLSQGSFQNYEIQEWYGRSKKHGIAKDGVPALSEYPYMLAQLGIFAGSIYYLPLIILVYKFLVMLWKRQLTVEHLTLGLALLGTMATGFNDPFIVVGWIWILYGICFAMFYGKDRP